MQQQEFIQELTPFENSSGKINHSRLKQFNRKVENSPYSVKYVTEGTERYKMDHSSFEVGQGQYLIVNANDEFTIDFDANEYAHGICIYPSEEMIRSAYEAKQLSLDKILEKDSNNQYHFLHQVNSTAKTQTGKYLDKNLPQLIQKLQKGDQLDLDAFFLDLVDYMVIDQINIDKKLINHSASKRATKEELFRRISLAKDFISDNFKEKVNIDLVAEMSCLSKYHFLRSFKEFYGMSPYQYLLSFKLNEAKKLRNQGLSYNEISLEVGFSDPKNLRKSMKKHGFID